jgi:hypothetical protein
MEEQTSVPFNIFDRIMSKFLLFLMGLVTFFINLFLCIGGFLALSMVCTPKIFYNLSGESFVL